MTRALHLHKWGPLEATRVICLHGITGSGGHFRTLADPALGQYRVLAPDLLGHGASPSEPPWSLAAHVAAVLAAVQEVPAVWIGHSFGGRLALEVAGARPELVERLVLLDPAIQVPPHNALQGAESARPDRSYSSFEEALEMRFEESMLLRAPRERVAGELRDHLVPGADGRWRYRYSLACVVAAYGEMATQPPTFEDVRVPTLVVAGADSYVPYGPFEAAHRAALGDLLEVVTVPGGHTVLWDAPVETAAAIRSFLGRS